MWHLFLAESILIYLLSVREYEKTNGFDWKQFYIRRFLRIFPCFYFYIVVILALAQQVGAMQLRAKMCGWQTRAPRDRAWF